VTLSQSELMRLLESLRRADGVEAIRVVCERILQELIEAEASDMIGAAPGEHSDKRTTWRNGHRERLLTTQAGDTSSEDPEGADRVVLPLPAGAVVKFRLAVPLPAPLLPLERVRIVVSKKNCPRASLCWLSAWDANLLR
jgi:hypothetical protein